MVKDDDVDERGPELGAELVGGRVPRHQEPPDQALEASATGQSDVIMVCRIFISFLRFF